MKDELNQKQQPPFHDIRQGVGMVVACAQIVSYPVQAWLRRTGTWGERFGSWQMMIGWMFIPFFGALMYPGHPQGPLTWFWGMTTALLAVHWLWGLRLRRKGYRPHSLYSGQPWIRGSELTVKCTVEPVLVCLAGMFWLTENTPLGAYLILSSVSLFIGTAYQKSAQDAQLRQMRDARLDREWIAHRMGEN